MNDDIEFWSRGLFVFSCLPRQKLPGVESPSTILRESRPTTYWHIKTKRNPQFVYFRSVSLSYDRPSIWFACQFANIMPRTIAEKTFYPTSMHLVNQPFYGSHRAAVCALDIIGNGKVTCLRALQCCPIICGATQHTERSNIYGQSLTPIKQKARAR